jgi:excisionase family DNA binding protein
MDDLKQAIQALKPLRLARVDRSGLLSVRAAAILAQVHADTIRRWIRQGRIPAYGWRGSYRVRLLDVLPRVGGEEPEES